jgi:coenzyme PQQ precursor peptide PqqA
MTRYAAKSYNPLKERANRLARWNSIMKQETAVKKVWTRPELKEVSLGCEINCYAPAEI